MSRLLYLTLLVICRCTVLTDKLAVLVKSTRLTSGYSALPLQQAVYKAREQLSEVHYPDEWKSKVLLFISTTHKVMNIARKSVRMILALPLSIETIKMRITKIIDLVSAEMKALALCVDPGIVPKIKKSITDAGDHLKSELKQARRKSLHVSEIADVMTQELRDFFATSITGFDAVQESIMAQAKTFSVDALQAADCLVAFQSLLVGDTEKVDSLIVSRDVAFHKAIGRRLRDPKSEDVFRKYRQREIAWYVYYNKMTDLSLFTELVNMMCEVATTIPGKDIMNDPDFAILTRRQEEALRLGGSTIDDQHTGYITLKKVVESTLWASRAPRIDTLSRLETEAAKYFSTRPDCCKLKKKESEVFKEVIDHAAKLLRS